MIIFVPNIKHNIIYIDKLSEGKKEKNINTIEICLINNNSSLEMIKIPYNNENVYEYIINMYDEYRNSLPLDYKTPLYGNIDIISIKQIEEKIILEISEIDENTNIRTFLTALIKSYAKFDIKEMIVVVKEKKYTINKDGIFNVEYDYLS